jgi:hypothetical protein
LEEVKAIADPDGGIGRRTFNCAFLERAKKRTPADLPAPLPPQSDPVGKMEGKWE